MKYISALALLALFPLAACGGGGSSSAVAPSVAHSNQTAKVTIKVKASAVKQTASNLRKPKYVSYSTSAGTVTVNGGTPVKLTCVTSTDSTCSALSATVQAPYGTDTFAVVLTDSATPIPNVLSQGFTTSTITMSGPNEVDITCDGVVVAGTITIPSISATSVTVGVPSTIEIQFTGQDADGNTITGNLDNLSFGMYDGANPGDAGQFSIPAGPYVTDSNGNATAIITYTPTTPALTPGHDIIAISMFPNTTASTPSINYDLFSILPAPDSAQVPITIVIPPTPTP